MEKIRKILPDLLKGLADKDFRGVNSLLADLLPADALELIEELDTLDRVVVFRLLPKRTAAEVFTDLPPDEQAELLDLFSEKQAADLFEEMDPDDRAFVLEEFPAGIVKDLLRIISPEERLMTSTLLGYPDNSAGRIMTPEFVDLRGPMSVEQAIERIRNIGPDRETIYVCYVIGPYRKLLGTVSLKEILLSPPGTRIEEIMTPEPLTAFTHDDQEEVAGTAGRYDLLAVPVVDGENRLVGIVTIDDLIDVIEEEASEDVYRMAGMVEIPTSYLDTSLFTLFRKRAIWLLLFMVAQTISGGILKHYEDAMAQVLALIFFIPMLVGSAGNTGTQSATLVIRGLATGAIDVGAIGRVFARESIMGIMLGILLGVVGGGIAALLGQNALLFVVVAISFMCTILTANLVGAIMPLVFEKMGMDPALMAGPVITTVVDVGGLIIYFQIARIVFGL